MAKLIFIARHAEAPHITTAAEGATDFDRTLSNKGTADATRAGSVLSTFDILPQYIYYSPALRTRQTAELINQSLKLTEEHCIPVQSLYLANATDWLTLIHQLDDSINAVLIVGHNPAVTETGRLLAEKAIDSFKPCTILGLEFEVQSWKAILPAKGKIIFKFEA